MSAGKKGVIEGRDVATHIIPDADLKIYLTADVEERARRRYKQLRDKQVEITFEEVKEDVIERDHADSNREHAPLVVSQDSFIIDTSNDTVEDTVGKVISELQNRHLL